MNVELLQRNGSMYLRILFVRTTQYSAGSHEFLTTISGANTPRKGSQQYVKGNIVRANCLEISVRRRAACGDGWH